MKEINLEKILHLHSANTFDREDMQTLKDIVLRSMKDACNQTVELCVENAEARMGYPYEFIGGVPVVEKDSILKSKKQIR